MRMKRIGCVALIFLLICFPVSVLAGGSNSISVHLRDIGTSMDGVRFDAYRVGTVKNGVPEIDKQFNVSTFPQEAYRIDETAKDISSRVSGKPYRNGTTDKDGKTIFEGLEDGVYLIKISGSDRYGDIAPFLVYLPYYEDGREFTSVTVEPKAAKKEDYTNPPSTGTGSGTYQRPKPDWKPDGSQSGAAVTGNSAKKHDQEVPVSNIKTGDDTEIMQYAAAFMIAALTGIILVLGKRKEGAL